ncbi:MAG: HIT family protein [Thermomicrobiales bacterium]|nr:HIT family protein [Thermomicrobiales bacterium]
MLLDASAVFDNGTPETERGCPFCAIIRGDAPADIVLDEPAGIAFLDRRPLLPGHLLVTPRAHVATLAGLPAEAIGPFFGLVQRIAAVIPEALGVHGSFVAINNRVSQSVPHLHAHIVPRRHDDRLFSRNLAWTRHPYHDDAERQAVAEAIREALAGEERPVK